MEAVTEKKINRQGIAAVVVLYYPKHDVLKNIMSYYEQVDSIVLVDNSESSTEWLYEKFTDDEKLHIVTNRCNLGIAKALNQGALIALANNYRYLLTMDQDSCATPGMVNSLKKLFSDPELDKLAIAAPFHCTSIDRAPEDTVRPYVKKDTVWTSGNLLSLDVYCVAGPFVEELFIDFVDHEYCLRLKRLGYDVAQSSGAILYHGFGNNLRALYFFKKPIIITNHSPLRRYYITRNRLWVSNNYSEFEGFVWIDRRRFVTELILILLFENEKLEKYKMIIKGIFDYINKKMGKYEEL